MKTKEEIVENWLPRYTGTPLDKFGDYILLTNFSSYLEMFAKKFDVEIIGKDMVLKADAGFVADFKNNFFDAPKYCEFVDIIWRFSV